MDDKFETLTQNRLPLQALVVVRFHATHGQEIVSIYPPIEHNLSEQQLSDVSKLAMQEGIEPSPNQKSRFVFKIRNKIELGYHCKNKSSNDLYGYTCFKRCMDTTGSARGFFHQSIVLITNIHAQVGLFSSAGCAYRSLFFSIVSRLDEVIADLPALEEAVAALNAENKAMHQTDKPSSNAQLSDGTGKLPPDNTSSACGIAGGDLSPTAHSLRQLHQALEVAWIHIKQWCTADGLFRAGAKQALPFFGNIIEFSLPANDIAACTTHRTTLQTNSNACLVLSRLGLLPHLWTLWELLQRGKDILVCAPSAAITSSVILALAELLLPSDIYCCGYDIRPYIGTGDTDVYEILTKPRGNSIGAITGSKIPPAHARLVGISNPFLLRAFESYDCAILLPNPDIGYNTSSVFVNGKVTEAVASSTSLAHAGLRNNDGIREDNLSASKHFSFSSASRGISSFFSAIATTAPEPAHSNHPDAKVTFSPLGVGYICSSAYNQTSPRSSEQWYDVDENGSKVYRPALGPPQRDGTPYSTVGAIPSLLRALDAKQTRGTGFEAAHDDWIARKAHKMPVDKNDQRGMNGSAHNHSRYGLLGCTTPSKCHGLVLVRGQKGRIKGAAGSILPEPSVQAELDQALSSVGCTPGSTVAIADVILRDHFAQLQEALLAPFELLRTMYEIEVDDEENAGKELRAYYGCEELMGNHRMSEECEEFGSEAMTSLQLDKEDLLIGAIAAFQRNNMPVQVYASGQIRSSWASAPTASGSTGSGILHVPSCIRKQFFDQGFQNGSSSGAVCSPFMLDVFDTRFVYDWLRSKR